MVVIIQRKLDNKYLESLENDTWTENIKLATNMSYKEHESTKLELLKIYKDDDI